MWRTDNADKFILSSVARISCFRENGVNERQEMRVSKRERKREGEKEQGKEERKWGEGEEEI